MDMKAMVAVLVVTCGALCGCSRRNPLKDFTAVVNNFSASPDNCYPERPDQKVGTPDGMRYNLRKTDSLVSPYIATADYSRSADTKRDGAFVVKFTAAFAYQDDKWVLQDVSATVPNPGSHSNIRVEPETRCWEAALDKFYRKNSN